MRPIFTPPGHGLPPFTPAVAEGVGDTSSPRPPLTGLTDAGETAPAPPTWRECSPAMSWQSDASGNHPVAPQPERPRTRPDTGMKLLQSELTRKLSLAQLNPDVVMTPAELAANPFCRLSIEAQLVGDDELTSTARSPVKSQKRQADEPADELAHEHADAGPSQLPEKRSGKRATRSNGEFELGSSSDSQRSLLGKSAPW